LIYSQGNNFLISRHDFSDGAKFEILN